MRNEFLKQVQGDIKLHKFFDFAILTLNFYNFDTKILRFEANFLRFEVNFFCLDAKFCDFGSKFLQFFAKN